MSYSYLGLMEMHICRRGPRLMPKRTEQGVTGAISELVRALAPPPQGSGSHGTREGPWCPPTRQEGEASQHPQPLLLRLPAVRGGCQPDHQPQSTQAGQEAELWGERQVGAWHRLAGAVRVGGVQARGLPATPQRPLTWKRWVTTLM